MKLSVRLKTETSKRLIIGSCALSAAAWLAVSFFSPRPLRCTASYATLPAESRLVPLPDGSTAYMGPASEIELCFEGKERIVRHIDGDTIYTVRRDPLRPFVIHTGLAIVEAVGTKFGVSHRRGRTEVTMSAGETVVARAYRLWNRTLNDTVHLAKGQQVVVEPDRPMLPRAIDADAWLAWEHRLVHFKQATVEDAVAAFNRHNVIPLSLPTDPDLKAITVTGTYRLDDPDYFAGAIKERLQQYKEARQQGRQQ